MLAIGSFQISVGDETGPAVAGARNVDHVEIQRLDHPVEVDIDEVQSGRTPVSEEPRLHMRQRQFFRSAGIVPEVDLAN